MITLTINNVEHALDIAPDTPLLWAIRDHVQLTGTKYACGMALCGACSVLMDGKSVRSCVTPVSAAEGSRITTIEAIGDTSEGHAVQQAWKELEVVQCGFCQSGQIVSAAALLAENSRPSDADIDAALGGNLCRCNTYHRVRAGVHAAARKLKSAQ